MGLSTATVFFTAKQGFAGSGGVVEAVLWPRSAAGSKSENFFVRQRGRRRFNNASGNVVGVGFFSGKAAFAKKVVRFTTKSIYTE